MQPACQFLKRKLVKVFKSAADIARSRAANTCRPCGNKLQSHAEPHATPRLTDWHAFCSYLDVNGVLPLRQYRLTKRKNSGAPEGRAFI